jgi:hypothetical protein
MPSITPLQIIIVLNANPAMQQRRATQSLVGAYSTVAPRFGARQILERKAYPTLLSTLTAFDFDAFVYSYSPPVAAKFNIKWRKQPSLMG